MIKGNISVQTENIFPIIKKFLYSDQEIFLRDLVSNAVDATTKLQTLAKRGDVTGEIGEGKSLDHCKGIFLLLGKYSRFELKYCLLSY